MTRENKAGLVVCGSFLCLVAAVVAVKLRQPPASDAPPVSPTLALSGAASPEKGKSETVPEPPSAAPAKEPPPPAHEPEAGPVMRPAPPGPSVEPPPAAPLPPGPAVVDPNHKDPVVPPPPGPSAPLPPVDPPAQDPPPLPPLPGHESDPPMPPAVEPPAPLPAPPPVDPPAPAEGMHEKKNGPEDEAPGHGPKKPKSRGEGGENVVAVPPTPPPDPPGPPAVPMDPAAEDNTHKNGLNNTKNGANSVAVPPVAGPAADPDARPKPPGPAAPEPPPLPGAPEPPAPPAPAPKAVEPPPLPSEVKIEPPSPAIVAPAPVKPIKIKPDAPADPPVKPGNVGVIPPDPPATAPPVAVAPTRPPAAAPSGPLVDSWDEQTYVCRPGDDFASICKANYPKDGYAKALELYNRNHPRASDAMRTSGALAPGEKVYIPPMNILEKRHGDAIASQKPASVGAAAPAGAGAVQADFRTVAPAAPTYTVKAPGERLYQIAARVLGDGQRWNEIGKLNPAVNPENVVPAGTVLTLPAATNAPPGGGR